MKNLLLFITIIMLFLTQLILGQADTNCFLEDYYPKYITAPNSELAQKPSESPTVFVTINSNDTLGKISNYMFGNAFPCWMGNVTGDQVLLNNLKILKPSFIRYPGGSWADIFFWNGIPSDIPDTIWDGNQNKWVTFYPQSGKGSWTTTVDNYYRMRDAIGCEGLITINYAYARYGTSDDPVAQAAHLAADWVRYDDGRTRFWEIGNENAGPWETGWKIDTTINKDRQPEVISGELYGKHFKVFVDSMKAAAAEINATIYIGGQVLHYDGTNSWNSVDKKWNEGFFKEAGNVPDFYLMHNYFGNQSNTLKGEIDVARTELLKDIKFIRSDISAKNAFSRPVAITEWNCNGPENITTSVANGMQAVVLFSEMIKNNFGLSARWLIATGETGLLYAGSNTEIPAWNPRPAYFYIYFLEYFTGDHSINTSVSGSSDILAYATTFTSGHDAIVIVNKGSTSQTVKINPFK